MEEQEYHKAIEEFEVDNELCLKNRIIIAGSRTFNNYEYVKKILDMVIGHIDKAIILSGSARGVDKLGEQYAKEKGYRIWMHEADWDNHGKSAGPIRNSQMVTQATQAIFFWDGKSKGTRDCINKAFKKGIPVTIVKIA